MGKHKPDFKTTDLAVRIDGKDLLWTHPQGFFSVYRLSYQHELLGQARQHQALHHIVDKAPACLVLPYDPIRDTVLLIEQIRSAQVFQGQKPYSSFEICGGVVDSGESYEAAARRELKEESGLDAQHLEKIMSWWSSPGWSTEQLHLYCAQVSLDESLVTYHVNDHGAEATRSVVVPVSAFLAALDDGLLNNAAAIIAAQWFARHHEQIRARWHYNEKKMR